MKTVTARKLGEYLNDGEFAIVNSWIDKNTLGLIDYEKKIIYLNIYLMVANVFIHECMHDVYKHTAEDLIQDATNRRIQRMKVDEIVDLAKDIFNNMEDGYLTGHKPSKGKKK